MKTNKRIIKHSNNLSSIAFVLLLALPLLGSAFIFNASDTMNEKRELATLPSFAATFENIENFPKEFDAFYKDHFGFRATLIESGASINRKVFFAGSTDKATIGKNGWAFYAKAIRHSKKTFTINELNAIQKNIEERALWLNKRGIKYIVLIAPNKATIYPEHTKHSSNKSTRLNLLASHLKKNSSISFVDVRGTLINGKQVRATYTKYDTHWTHYGALLVYQDICKELQKWFLSINAKAENDFTIEVKENVDDLAIVLALNEKTIREFFIPNKKRNARRVGIGSLSTSGTEPTLVFEQNIPKLRLLSFHDSFFEAGNMRELLAEHFSRSTFIWEHLPFAEFKRIVETEKPNVVIDELVERNLDEMSFDVSE